MNKVDKNKDKKNKSREKTKKIFYVLSLLKNLIMFYELFNNRKKHGSMSHTTTLQAEDRFGVGPEHS